MFSLKMAICSVAFLFSAGATAVGVVSFQPRPMDRAVEVAARCAGFRAPVPALLAQSYDEANAMLLDDLPEDYEIKATVVHADGGCLTIPAGKFQSIASGEYLVLQSAVGFLMNDGELPLYVIWERPRPEGSSDRIFVTIRLPASALFVPPDPQAGPERIA